MWLGHLKGLLSRSFLHWILRLIILLIIERRIHHLLWLVEKTAVVLGLLWREIIHLRILIFVQTIINRSMITALAFNLEFLDLWIYEYNNG